ncbi:hypothetical protein C8R44DRAFT_895226 [Mycena epipterygia]|nr:hypothetical protein C8R44DRAFT_895226 [Mycena epipterygia]
MQLMYVNRTAQMTEMWCLMDEDPSLQVFDAYRLVKEFLVDMDETPMAFLFESYVLLKVITSDEYTDQDASFQDALFTELNYQGETVRLRDFTTLLITLQQQYATIVKEEIFFNDEELHPDDAKEDKPINLQRAGGSARGTDVAAQSVRNRPACAIRNIQFLFRNLTLITIQDKTTHNHMKDRFVPKTPAPSVSEDLVYSLVIFRNFPTSVARELLDDEAAHRFHESLWPRLFATLTSAALRSTMGDITEDEHSSPHDTLP